MQKNPSNANNPLNEKKSPVDVVVYGEVLYDCFPDERRVLGGAPFNTAWGLTGFGHNPLFISAVGEDEGGANIRQKMAAWGMSTSGLQTNDDYATGEVFVTINGDEPSYEVCAPRAWDCINDSGFSAQSLIYHGLLSLRDERSSNTLKSIIQRSSAKRFFDVNLRPPYDSLDTLYEWIKSVCWLKLNIDELAILLQVESISFCNSVPYVDQLIERFDIENVLLTGGSQGALIRGRYGFAMCAPAPTPDRFVDTVGAGDSFSAFAIHGILTGLPVQQIIEQASHFASKVCGLQGATTDSKEFYTKQITS